MSQVSPFQKKRTEFRKEQTAVESFWQYAVSRLDKMFLDYLPSDDIKAMSPEYLYPIGCIVFISLIGIFLAVFLSGYYSTLNKEFLSPFSGSTAQKNCLTIPTINTGTYLATQEGHWQGQDDFEYGKATYEIATVSTEFSTDEYAFLMDRVYDNLQFVKNISVNYDLAANLVAWMSSTFIPYAGNTAQRLTFIGTPLVVFNRQKIVGTVSSVMGDCNASSTATFNAEDGMLTLSYDYEEYVNNPVCNNSISPAYLSYLPATDNGYFSLHLDTRSIITAVAVNMGVTDMSNLVVIEDLSSVYTFEGVNYTVTVAYDPKYNGMEPISCVNISGSSFCILKVQNEVYAIPLFNHYGMSLDLPTPCNCSTIDPANLNNSYYSCNLFSFLTGVLFFPNNSPDEVFRMWLDIGLTYINQVYTSPINSLAYDAQWIDSYWGRTSPSRDQFLEPAYRQQAYQFCNITGNNGSCSLITFSIFDKTPQNWAVSDYYYQLLTGACRNTFVPPYDQWLKLIETPFAPLNQNYQKCHLEHTTVMFNQAGSSVGNLSILAPFCIALILVCVYCAQVCGLATIKKTYTTAEKEEALADFALKLLLARDADKAMTDRDSVLTQLVEELGKEVDTSTALYREGRRSSQPSVVVDWAALQTSMGLRKRRPSAAGETRTEPAASVVSVSDGAVFVPESGDELQPVNSPIHFLAAAPSVLAVQAAKHKYVIMNDYEVTPALLQLCGSKRLSQREKRSASKDQRADLMEAGQAVSSVVAAQDARDGPAPAVMGQTASMDVDALLQLLDSLITTFEVVHTDRSKNVWNVVSQTAILRTVQASALPEHHQSALYYKLHTLLSLHASIMLNVPVKEIKQSQASGVAYIVGMEVLTLADIRARL